MKDRLVAYGIGNALLDIRQRIKEEEIESFHVGAGGITPNILSAYRAVNPRESRLFARVGPDDNGKAYAKQTYNKLGPLQIDGDQATGYTAIVYDEANTASRNEWNLGAAPFVQVPEQSLRRSRMCITDLLAVRSSAVLTEANKLLRTLDPDEGYLVLNLGGMASKNVDYSDKIATLNAFIRKPDVIFGNIREFASYVQKDEGTLSETDFARSFPDARMIVMTRGAEGAAVRLNGNIFEIPALPVHAKQFIDETGAGDNFQGVMLGVLDRKPIYEWDESHAKRAGHAASYAASLIVQSYGSRLNYGQIRQVRKLLGE